MLLVLAVATVAMVFVVAANATPFGWALLAASFLLFLMELALFHADWIRDDS